MLSQGFMREEASRCWMFKVQSALCTLHHHSIICWYRIWAYLSQDFSELDWSCFLVCSDRCEWEPRKGIRRCFSVCIVRGMLILIGYHHGYRILLLSSNFQFLRLRILLSAGHSVRQINMRKILFLDPAKFVRARWAIAEHRALHYFLFLVQACIVHSALSSLWSKCNQHIWNLKFSRKFRVQCLLSFRREWRGSSGRRQRHHGGDHQRHGVPGHREAEASQDGLRLLRLRRRGRVDAQGEPGGLLQDPVSIPLVFFSC